MLYEFKPMDALAIGIYLLLFCLVIYTLLIKGDMEKSIIVVVAVVIMTAYYISPYNENVNEYFSQMLSDYEDNEKDNNNKLRDY